MFDLRFDKSKNLLNLSYTGRVGPEEVQACAEQLKLLLAEVSPSFRLLTDLSELESVDVAAVPYIEQMMDLLNAHGVDTVVRVIPDPHKDIGLNILSLFHYHRGVHIVTSHTLEEAMNTLAV